MEQKQITEAEAEERRYLAEVNERIRRELERNNEIVGTRMRDSREMKEYLSKNKADMDHVEKVGVRQTVDELGAMGEHSAEVSRRLEKLLASAYFGRIDFRRSGTSGASPVYIGIHSFYDNEEKRVRIHDWRAPVSSMFYDYETGPAQYEAPDGTEEGEIERKRQYRIEDGELVFMIESSLNIQDEVLQEELRHNTSDKMKNIVATIQRDQNAIVRNEKSHTLVIQGAAGSGKTSIALHRIAFLLYRFKETISSSDVLIISPNRVFAHYISNVLPELGEENIREATMEDLAAELLEHKYAFEPFYTQVSRLLKGGDRKYRERIQFRATPEFLEQLDAYIVHVKNNRFVPADVMIGHRKISADILRERYHRFAERPFAEQVNELVETVLYECERHYGHEIKGKERTEVRKQIGRMFASQDIAKLYRDFYHWVENPSMFKYASKGVYEHADVFPLIYFSLQLEGGREDYRTIKHLVIDEMQDYTPVHYAVLGQLFPCKRTILGDARQSVNPLSSSTAEGIRGALGRADCVYLNKSYRSTLEIAEFAQNIQRNEDLVPIERHGEAPAVLACANSEEETECLRERVRDFFASDRRSLGIICKTQAEAESLFENLENSGGNIHLIRPDSTTFPEGALIATAYLAKGLEFDEVLVPHVDDRNYQNEVDRHMLYVAVTRAMHKLTLTHTGKRSRLL